MQNYTCDFHHWRTDINYVIDIINNLELPTSIERQDAVYSKLNELKTTVDNLITDYKELADDDYFKYVSDDYRYTEESYISEDATDDILQDRTYIIPDVPLDYIYDIVEYGKSIGMKENQFDYDDATETLTITYSPYSGLESDKCMRVHNMFIDLYNSENEDFDD